MNPRFLVAAALALAGCASAPQSGQTPAPSATPAATPAPSPYAPPTLPRAQGIKVPAGFGAYVYSQGLRHPTAMAFGPDGRLYVTQEGNSVVVVPGPGGGPSAVISGIPTPLGLAWRGSELFVSAHGRVLGYRLEDGRLTGGTIVVSGLPTGRHWNDNLLLMPNGDFLLGVGSTCDVCTEADERSATVLRFRADWTYAGIVVRGARNPYGLALRRSAGDAYVTINGQDNLGTREPADHLLRVVDGTDAGWPRCWPSVDQTLHGSCAGVTPAVALFEAHSSADGIVFYDGRTFPSEYRDNAFVAEWGDNAGTPLARKVVRVVLTGTGAAEHGTVTNFATGFDHPLALAVAPDGGLLVADYGTGLIVEIAPDRAG